MMSDSDTNDADDNEAPCGGFVFEQQQQQEQQEEQGEQQQQDGADVLVEYDVEQHQQQQPDQQQLYISPPYDLPPPYGLRQQDVTVQNIEGIKPSKYIGRRVSVVWHMEETNELHWWPGKVTSYRKGKYDLHYPSL
jgi:16S rRNA G966 N2-methylase RsmD